MTRFKISTFKQKYKLKGVSRMPKTKKANKESEEVTLRNASSYLNIIQNANTKNLCVLDLVTHTQKLKNLPPKKASPLKTSTRTNPKNPSMATRPVFFSTTELKNFSCSGMPPGFAASNNSPRPSSAMNFGAKEANVKTKIVVKTFPAVHTERQTCYEFNKSGLHSEAGLRRIDVIYRGQRIN